MTEPDPSMQRIIGQMYDEQAQAYEAFADERYAWNFLEKPAFDSYIADLYVPETRVLEIGCGTGTVARHLIKRGILPQNITGIDISEGLLEQARVQTPGVTFLQDSADTFELPSGGIDLVVTNTVLHHLDNEMFRRMLERVYDVLAPNGTYFFVEVDPDHTDEGRDPRNANRWTFVKTPWSTEVPFFNRDPHDLIYLLYLKGFEYVRGWVLNVLEEGRIDTEKYLHYSSRPSRMAGRFRRLPEDIRDKRRSEVMFLKVGE